MIHHSFDRIGDEDVVPVDADQRWDAYSAKVHFLAGKLGEVEQLFDNLFG